MTAASIYRTPEGARILAALYDDLLAHWPVGREELTVATRHGATFVVASGDAVLPPLVLLHGAGTNAAMWRADVAHYSRAFRVYAVDLLGEPGRSAPNRPPWEGAAWAEWLSDVLDGLGLARARLAGLSQGGFTALKFAVAQPERVERLALLTPGGVVPDKASFLLKAVFYMTTGKWGMRRMMRMLYGAAPVPDGVEEVTALFMRHFNGRTGTLPLFADAELSRLTMPVLLVCGSQDALRDGAAIEARLRSFVPTLQAVTIAGGGHALLGTLEPVMAFLQG